MKTQASALYKQHVEAGYVDMTEQARALAASQEETDEGKKFTFTDGSYVIIGPNNFNAFDE